MMRCKRINGAQREIRTHKNSRGGNIQCGGSGSGILKKFTAGAILQGYKLESAFLNDAASTEPAHLRGADGKSEEAVLYYQPMDKSVYVSVSASSQGAWGNEVTVAVSGNVDFPGTFDVSVNFKDVNEKYTAMSNDLSAQRYFAVWINNRSSLITRLRRGCDLGRKDVEPELQF